MQRQLTSSTLAVCWICVSIRCVGAPNIISARESFNRNSCLCRIAATCIVIKISSLRRLSLARFLSFLCHSWRCSFSASSPK
nr:hypothetical protein [Thecaphora frezii]